MSWDHLPILSFAEAASETVQAILTAQRNPPARSTGVQASIQPGDRQRLPYPKSITEAEIQTMIRLAHEGYCVRAIAEHTGRAYDTTRCVLVAHKAPRPARAVTPENVRQWRAWHRDGVSVEDIALRVGRTLATVANAVLRAA